MSTIEKKTIVNKAGKKMTFNIKKKVTASNGKKFIITPKVVKPVAKPVVKKAVAPAKVKKARKTFMNSTTSAEFDRMKKDFPIGIQVLRLNSRVATVAQRKKIGWYEGTMGEMRASTIPDGWKVSAHTATGITIKKNDMKLNIPWKRADNWTY